MHEFFIPGSPIAKGRPKFSSRGGFVRSYTPAKTRDYEAYVLSIAQKYLSEPLEGPLCVDLLFCMPIPLSLSKKRQEALIGQPHIKRPDLDNCIKSVSDALNRHAWLDDSQIVDLRARKVYSCTPGVKVKITAF